MGPGDFGERGIRVIFALSARAILSPQNSMADPQAIALLSEFRGERLVSASQ